MENARNNRDLIADNNEALRARIEELELGHATELAQLEESEGKYRNLFEAAPIGITVVDKDRRLLESNPSFQKMTGLQPGDPRGQNAGEWLFSPPDSQVPSGFDRLVSGETDLDHHVRQWFTAQGDAEWIEVVNSAVRDGDGNFRYAIGMSLDVTERQQQENYRKRLYRLLAESKEDQTRLIARELHDEVGQLLTGLKLQLESRTPEAMDSALVIATDLMKHVRLMALDLRPAALDDLGLVPALESLCIRFTERTGVHVDLDCKRYAGEASSAVEEAAFRVVQESLTNVARHAGVAEAQVEVRCTDDELIVQVKDEGRGTQSDLAALAADASSMGIAAMFERVSALGGTPHFKSIPGSGTVVSATLPLDELAG